MRVEPPPDVERDAVRRALLEVADDLWISPDRPLAWALFVTRAGLVARELVDELVRTDRFRHDLTYGDIGTAFGITAQSAHHRFARHVSPRT